VAGQKESRLPIWRCILALALASVKTLASIEDWRSSSSSHCRFDAVGHRRRQKENTP